MRPRVNFSAKKTVIFCPVIEERRFYRLFNTIGSIVATQYLLLII